MRVLQVLLAAGPLFGALAEPIRRRDALSEKIWTQTARSHYGVMDNIGPKGSKAPGAQAGIIIASPSTEDPNYFYTWTRDAGLTMKMIVDEFLHGKKIWRSYIQDYVKAQAILQTVSNPSGALGSGRGLGEPKYYSNLTRFNGNWGRPQRDGPALRATALITYSEWLLSTGNKEDATEAKEVIWPVVQNDLNYVAQYWNDTGFDLWEEVLGSSFFATAVQHRALVEGAAFEKKLGLKATSAYTSQAANLRCFLQTYWNGKYAVANINTQEDFNRTGIDANTVLASIATYDPEAECDSAFFQPCSDRALANLKVYVDSFRDIYTINQGAKKSAGIATGRYSEDVYYEGNPWYLTTLAVAEQLYNAISQWSTIKKVEITDTSLDFWKTVYPSAEVGTYDGQGYGNSEFNKLLDAVLDYADSFVNVALKYIPSDGSLAEQYSRENGTVVSARHLTWSYASFLTMASARLSATSDFPSVPSWGSKHAKDIPEKCEASSIVGAYKPALKAGAPPGSGGCTLLVHFNLNASTYFGENVYLLGSTPDLGDWRLSDALPGSANNYNDERPLWTFIAELPATKTLHYQYVRQEPDGNVLYETKNRTLIVPPCANVVGGGNSTVEDAWVGPTGTPKPQPSSTATPYS